MATQIQGVDRLVLKLDRLSTAAQNSFIKKACMIVEAEAKKQCPVRDGELRQSITSELISDGVGAVGTNLEYAPYVHQGTGIYAVNGDGRKDPWSYQDEKGEWHTTIGQHPNPFLERALDNKRKEIVGLARKTVRECVKNG